jgi:hypothetical protein
MSASSLIVVKIQSMTDRNSFGEENSAPMAQLELEPEPVPRERVDVERVRVPVDREAAGFFAAGLRAAGFLAAGFAALDFAAVDLAAVDREAVDRDRAAVDRDRVAAGFAAGADVDGRSRFATRRASVSTSVRSLPSSSSTPCCSSDSRTRETAFATSSTICAPRSLEPSGSARSTALRTASMVVSVVPEPFLVSFFFLLSFLAMGRV